MKAAVFKEVGQPLSVETVDDPTPEPSELVMKVGYCGICGTDLHATREGLTTACCGQILGHEYVGEIAEESIRISMSRNGNFLSITITIEATSQNQLDNIYNDLSGHDEILVAL